MKLKKNTLDTTVHYGEEADGTPDTYVYTGDIPAMWLRDSGAQVCQVYLGSNSQTSMPDVC